MLLLVYALYLYISSPSPLYTSLLIPYVTQLEATADILEREAFVGDESDIMLHPLVRTTEVFLEKHLGIQSCSHSNNHHGKSQHSDSSGAGRSGGKKGSSERSKNKTEGDSLRLEGTVAAAVVPNIVLFISLSGGKILPCYCNLSKL